MGPPQKRARTKPPAAEASAHAVEHPPSTTAAPASAVAGYLSNASSIDQDCPAPLRVVKPDGSSNKQLIPKDSWYGTWPRKSTASTQVARETILADKQTSGVLSADLNRFEPRKAPTNIDERPPSMMVGKSKETADITLVGMLEDSKMVGNDANSNKASSAAIPSKPPSAAASNTPSVEVQTETKPHQEDESDVAQRPTTASSWLGWLGRPAVQSLSMPDNSTRTLETSETPPITGDVVQQPEQPTIPILVGDESKSSNIISPPWFGLWSTAERSIAPDLRRPPTPQTPIKLPESAIDPVLDGVPVSELRAEPVSGSNWAFWSTNSARNNGNSSKGSIESGQLAVIGEASQNHPKPAKAVASRENRDSKSNKRGRTQSVEVDESSQKTAMLNLPSSTKGTPSQSPTPVKSSPPNLLIPSIRSTYRLVESPSILQQIARLLLHGHQQPVKHVFLVKEPPKIKRALAIGIHGLFPAPLIRTVIGQPTGTSIRFANHAAAAIRRWTDQNGSLDCEIEKVALEGEGKIAERADTLWKLLLNWVDQLRNADFILVACHSQGVPVGLMLIAKLIEFGVVSTARIGVCAMAGVSLGPFADYKSRLFSGSAGELFDFADPESVVSKKYEDSIRVAVKYGVRVTYCGSIDDQLISMESSIFSTVSHPYIYRAVFVDGRIHAPDFLAHLVGLALKLRNLGVSDHGLIRELSAPLAGSLYTGEGHSRLYDDDKVYDLAVEYALETSSVGDVPLQIQKYEIPTNSNPYVLPWIMRGLLEEDFVKTELDRETMELLKQFDDWKPATKVLKDVKYRLEAVRSKL